MPISKVTITKVANADVAMNNAFHSSIRYWHNGGEPPTIIDGDCLDDVSLPNGGVLHIHGDLAASVAATGHVEIIIVGTVLHGATITASGFCHVFVGGDLSGSIVSTDSTKIWVGSNFSGVLKTGDPSTHLNVGGNLTGSVLPAGKPCLLYTNVAGFAPNQLLTDIANLGYTLFHAAIAFSDVEPGIYPDSGDFRKRSLNRWSVADKHA